MLALFHAFYVRTETFQTSNITQYTSKAYISLKNFKITGIFRLQFTFPSILFIIQPFWLILMGIDSIFCHKICPNFEDWILESYFTQMALIWQDEYTKVCWIESFFCESSVFSLKLCTNKYIKIPGEGIISNFI